MTSTTCRDVVAKIAATAALLAGLEFVAQSAVAHQAEAGGGQGSAHIERLDFIIAGAGHNSLTCGAYLANAVFSVLVLEDHQVISGRRQLRPVPITSSLRTREQRDD
jgi:NAD(P)-binding Rossmann-like domain